MPGHGLHLDVAFGDDHEPDAALTADDDLVPGRVVHGLELLLDRSHLGVGQPLEQLRLFDLDHVRILCLLFAVEELLVEAVGLLFAAVYDLGVALEGVEVRVAQHLLDQADVTSCYLEQRGGGRMARDVW